MKNCKTCGGPLDTVNMLTRAHSNPIYAAQGHTEAYRCPECVARQKSQKVIKLYERAGLPAVLHGYCLPADAGPLGTPVDVTEPGWKDIPTHAENIRAASEMGVNFLFLGPRGRGKSQAGALIISQAVKQGLTALAVSVPDWLMWVMSDYSGGQGALTEFQHIERLFSVDLLMLDDVGADLTKDHAHAQRLLSRIISKRYDAAKSTILTTNLTARADNNALAELLGGRAYDRFIENSVKLVFDGKDFRAESQRTRVSAYLDMLGGAAM